jgi:hypothetical protein
MIELFLLVAAHEIFDRSMVEIKDHLAIILTYITLVLGWR